MHGAAGPASRTTLFRRCRSGRETQVFSHVLGPRAVPVIS